MPSLVRKPTLAAESYRARLAKLVGGTIRDAYAPLLAALPRLAGAMEAQRTDAARRSDASPVDEASRLARDAAAAFGGGFAKQVRTEVQRAADNVTAHTKGQLRRQLDEHKDRRVNEIRLTDSPKLRPIIEGFAAENAALITGISPQLASQVQALVVQGLTNGTPHERLARQVRERLDVSANRAELIAIDQVGKLDGLLSAQRVKDLGVTHFFWRSSDDERVRGNPSGLYPKATPSHWERNGQRYAYDDLPKGKRGEPELPGTPVNCRCFQEPDFSTLPQVNERAAAASADPPAAFARSVDDYEDEAARMMAEVEVMLARQQEEIEERMRAAEAPAAPEPAFVPAGPPPLDDLFDEMQAQSLASQLSAASPAAAKAALARFRREQRKRSA